MHSRPAPHPAVPVRWAALVAVQGGLVGTGAYPRLGVWPLAFLSVAALSWAVDGRRSRAGAWLGLLYGAMFFGPLLHWTGAYVGPVPWLLLAGSQAAFTAGLGAVLPLVQRLPVAPLWVGSAWVLEEALRDRLPFGGFPWGRLAFSQADSPLRWLAALGGQPLLGFAVAALGGALAIGARHVRPVSWRPLAGCLVVLVAIPLVAGLRAWVGIPAPGSSSPTLNVALIQGNVPDRGLASFDRARQVLDNHVAQTLALAAQVKSGAVAQPDLVLWPENASDVDPLRDAAAAAQITRAVKAVGAPVLVGAILRGPGAEHRRNAGILWSPTTGPGAVYIKRHPVPFAEYIPLRSIAETVSSAAKLVTQDMVGGGGNGLLTGGPVPIGDVICFEVAYDDLVRSSVDAGARVVVVQTNNATFGRTAETYQQLAMSRLRAVETGLPVLQVSTTGETAIIGPDGGVVRRSGALFKPAILSDRIAIDPRAARPLAMRLGALPEYLLAALAGLGTAGALVAARRRRSGSRAEPADASPAADEMVNR